MNLLAKEIFHRMLFIKEKLTNYDRQKKLFYKKHGYKLNLNKPKTFSEKIIWKKINDRNPLIPLTADKFKVRDYIKKVLGEKKAREILIPLLYVTNDPTDIPFDNLPNNYVVKANHGSGMNLIVDDQSLSQNLIIEKSKEWLNMSYGIHNLEWAYQQIPRKIVVEKMIEDKNKQIPKDLRFYIFHGECEFVIVDEHYKKDRTIESTYDKKWNFIPARYSSTNQGPKIERPKKYDELILLAEKLGANFDFVRVDFYLMSDDVYIGEITHYPVSGLTPIIPKKYDLLFGEKWNIKDNYWESNDLEFFSDLV